jgi:hypothetical protein
MGPRAEKGFRSPRELPRPDTRRPAVPRRARSTLVAERLAAQRRAQARPLQPRVRRRHEIHDGRIPITFHEPVLFERR